MMFVSLPPVPAAERCVKRESIAFKISIADFIQRLMLKSCASSSSRPNLSLDDEA
ncbi:unnamed protein product [Arabidopsis lyrata]|nr:unnamed protein product [Arabidopsis lyrata]